MWQVTGDRGHVKHNLYFCNIFSFWSQQEWKEKPILNQFRTLKILYYNQGWSYNFDDRKQSYLWAWNFLQITLPMVIAHQIFKIPFSFAEIFNNTIAKYWIFLMFSSSSSTAIQTLHCMALLWTSPYCNAQNWIFGTANNWPVRHCN